MSLKKTVRTMVAGVVSLAILFGATPGLQTSLEGQITSGCPDTDDYCPSLQPGERCRLIGGKDCMVENSCYMFGGMCEYMYWRCTNNTQICTLGCCQWAVGY